ncbi:hypothetical protein QTP86_025165, partial [Hemibagrus guttatus]
MTREVKRLLRERGIREAKLDYRRRTKNHLDSNNRIRIRKSFIAKTNPGAAEGDAMLAEKLNLFFARFEVEPAETATPHLMALSNITLTVEESEKSHISSLSDYRPVALTPVVMKCFEKLVQSHITSLLPAGFDSHQFACRGNRSTEDAVATALHAAVSHLEKQGSYVRMFFVDYTLVFNTILPHILVGKLEDLGLPQSTCMWINSFPSNRSQRVRGGRHTSTALSLSTGSPQGWVLSPLLYTLYTHDCTPTHHSNTIVKFVDDTTVVGLIAGRDELAYRDEVEWLSGWCRENNLLLNTTKTKELIIDYRRKETHITPLYISGDCVERVADFRF